MAALSLFSGIGGLELGIGCETVCYVENDPYAAGVLVARMEEGALGPALVFADDVRTFDPTPWRGVELVTAGFPCQPASYAGNREGRRDPRWLWPEVARVVADVRPRAVFLECVPGLLTVDAGWAFHGIVRDLAALGYVGCYDLLRAEDAGAPHKRERWFCLAYRDGGGRQGLGLEESTWVQSEQGPVPLGPDRDGQLDWPPGPKDWESWKRWEPKAAVGGRLNVAFAEALMGYPIGWTDLGYPSPRHRLRCLGNAVVPAQARLAWRLLSTRGG